MRNDDVALIQRILTGDETAFESLIRKYQKQVHALAFRKTRNFQTAEDITQETFLRVHQKLATLNDPAKFSGWLYAIVNHLCIAWYRENRLQTESLQEIYISEIETDVYSRYIATEHAKTTDAAQQDLVKRLLTKLKESDREVITLHYFEEMTSSEIGEFLGVSENTIKSRLYRARQQLKKYESMIQEALDITTEGKHRSQHQLKGEINMSEEVKDRVKLETRQSFLEEKQRTLESNLEGLQGHRKEVVETRDRHLAEVDEKIQSITEEIDACRNELSKIADLQAELQTTTEALDATTNGEHHPQHPLKGETIMAGEVKDEAKVDMNPEEMQRSLAEMQDKILEVRRELAAVQARLKIITAQSDASIDSGKREALDALFRLPHDAKDPITWCYAGAYRAASGQQSRRGSIWSDSIDNFISRAPDAEIVKLAKFFTNPTVVAVLRQLVEGKKSVADLANGCGISESEMEKTVALLIDGSLVDRTKDGLIEPKNDAVFYFLNFVGMTRVYLDPEDH